MNAFSGLKEKILERRPQTQLLENEPMSGHTTLGVGGPVPLMAIPRNLDEAYAAVSAAAQEGIQTYFLGNGSNLLVSDDGADLFIIKTGSLSGFRLNGNYLTLLCGCPCSLAATYAELFGLKGMEFLYGIPGSLGGAICTNAGTFEKEFSQVVSAVTVLETSGYLSEITAPEFSPRSSAYSDGSRLVISAGFAMERGNPVQIGRKMAEIMEQKEEKQPLGLPSVGFVFKDPVDCRAADLIDSCGLQGLSVGGAQVSEKDARFIVNNGGATCGDVLTLMGDIRQRVSEATGTELEADIKLLGDDFPWAS